MRIPLPSVQQDPRPSGQFTARSVVPQQDATGQNLAAIGQGAQQLGDQVSGVADFLQDQLDYAKFTEASNLTSDARRETMLGEGGFLRLIGVNATGDSRKKAFEAFDKKVEGIGKTLTNDVQRARWKEKLAEQRERAMVDADNHEATQTHNYWKGVETASIVTKRIDGDKEGMLKSVDTLSKLNGEAPGEAPHTLRRLDATTQWHEQNIPLLAQTDPQMAATKLDEAVAAKEIDPARLDNLQRVVRQANMAGRDKAIKQAAFDVLKSDGVAAMPIGEKIDWLREQVGKEGGMPLEVYDAAVSRAIDDEKIDRDIKANEQNAILKTGKDWADANQGRDLSLMPEKALAALKDAGLLDDVEQHAASGSITTALGWRLFDRYRSDPSKLKGVSWPQFSSVIDGVMSRTEVTSTFKLWSEANDIDGSEAAKATRAAKASATTVNLSEFGSESDFHLRLMQISGLAEKDEDDLKDVDALEVNAFIRTLGDQVNARERKSNKPMQQDEILSMVRQWSIEKVQVGTKDRPFVFVRGEDFGITSITYAGQLVQMSEVAAAVDDPMNETGSTTTAARELVTAYNVQLIASGATGGLRDPKNVVDAMKTMAEVKRVREQRTTRVSMEKRDATAQARDVLLSEWLGFDGNYTRQIDFDKEPKLSSPASRGFEYRPDLVSPMNARDAVLVAEGKQRKRDAAEDSEVDRLEKAAAEARQAADMARIRQQRDDEDGRRRDRKAAADQDEARRVRAAADMADASRGTRREALMKDYDALTSRLKKDGVPETHDQWDRARKMKKEIDRLGRDK